LTGVVFFKDINKEKWLNWSLIGSLMLIFIGFVGFRALISIGVVCVALCATLSAYQYQTITLRNKRRVLLLSSLVILPYLLSYFYSEDKNMWAMWLTIKIPFLILPLSFFLLPEIKQETLKKILALYVGIMIISSLVVFGKYAMHFEKINNEFLLGGKVPAPFSHIRYSLLLSFAFFSCVWLYTLQKSKWPQIAGFYLFVAIHILGVRSGLLSLYAGVLFSVLYFIFKTKSWKLSAVIILLTALSATIAVNHLPTLRNRVAYMKYDYSQWKEGKIDGNSDAMRLASLQSGVALWKENFWMGTGTGDVLSESKTASKKLFPQIAEEENRKMPHNQFLWIGCSMGVIGMIFFLLSWLLPWFIRWRHLNYIAIIFQLIMLVSFMAEYTLEEQVGGTFFILFNSLLLNFSFSE
jgi:O-antigen ligase